MNRTGDQSESSCLWKTRRKNIGSRKRKCSYGGSPQKIMKLNVQSPKKRIHPYVSSSPEKLKSPHQADFPGFAKNSLLRRMCEKHLQDLRFGVQSVGSPFGESFRRDPKQTMGIILKELQKAFSLNGLEPGDPVRIKSMHKAEKLASDVQSLWTSVKSERADSKPSISDSNFMNPNVPLKFDTCWQNGFPVVFAADAPPTPLCLLCGSAGIEQMLYCSTCCEPYHLFCIDEDPRLYSIPSCYESERKESAIGYLWSCKRCWVCTKCGLKDNVSLCDDSVPDEIFRCDDCLGTFHYTCSGKNYLTAISLYSKQEVTFVRWICDDCVKCKSCHAPFADAARDKKSIRKHPEENSAVCKNCFKQIKKGSYCPVCNSAYDDNDYETRMLECGKCERWIHAACEDITEEQYQMISFLPNCADFACSLCETGSKLPTWKSVVNAYSSKQCEEVLQRFTEKVVSRLKGGCEERALSHPCIPIDTFTLSDSNLLPEKRSSSTECTNFSDKFPYPNLNQPLDDKNVGQSHEDTENDWSSSDIVSDSSSWSPTKQTILKAIENSCFGQNMNTRPGSLGSDSVGARQIVMRKVAAFVETLKCYPLKQSVKANSFTVKAFVTVSKASIARFCQEEIEGLLLQDTILQDFQESLVSVFSWCNDEMLGQKLPGGADKFPDIKPSAKLHQLKIFFWDSEMRLDSRRCRFCGSQGDLNPDGPGRLLWAGFSEWVHVNCALWSCEVWEDEHGGLHQVHSAVFRGKSQKCKLCQNFGATVSCCRSSCKNSYHFQCSIRSGCSMRNDMTVYCKAHRSDGEIQADFRVSRRVYVVDSSFRKKEKLISSENVKIIIGALRINSLGTLNAASTQLSNKDQNSHLVSDGLTCQRVYWSMENPCDLDTYELRTSINKCFEKRIVTVTPEEHIVIDHNHDIPTTQSGSAHLESKLKAFQFWTETAPVYIDEFGRDWLLHPSTAAEDNNCTLNCNSIKGSVPSIQKELSDGYNRFFNYASSLLSYLRLGQNNDCGRSFRFPNSCKSTTSEKFEGSSNHNPLFLPKPDGEGVKNLAENAETKDVPVHCDSCRRTYTTAEGYSLHLSLGHCYEYSSNSECSTVTSSDAEETVNDDSFLGSAGRDLNKASCQSSEMSSEGLWQRCVSLDRYLESCLSCHINKSKLQIIQASLSFFWNIRGSVLLETHIMSDISFFMATELQKEREKLVPALSLRQQVHSTPPTLLNFTHPAIQFLFEQLPGNEFCLNKHRFVYHRPTEDPQCKSSYSPGVARFEGYTARKPFDMFGWLASKHRKLKCIDEGYVEGTQQDLPVAMRYRNLKEKTCQSLFVYYSEIHGRGLFTRRPIHEGELIIEYAGELIRSVLADVRERKYESKGIGCYFFTIDEKLVVDATMKGNAARFINHSCEPNCKSRVVDILGKKKILIFADRRILGGEELTYDYKFAFESDDKKLPCGCRARKCRKYMN